MIGQTIGNAIAGRIARNGEPGTTTADGKRVHSGGAITASEVAKTKDIAANTAANPVATQAAGDTPELSDEFIEFLLGDDASETLNLSGLLGTDGNGLFDNFAGTSLSGSLGDWTSQTGEAGLVPIEFETYNTSDWNQLNWFERLLVGMEAHRILTTAARTQQGQGWWADNYSDIRANSAGDPQTVNFVGRPDLGLNSFSSRFVWELKPNNLGAIARGEAQLGRYVTYQYDPRDGLGSTYDILNPYQIARAAPWDMGLRLEPNVGHQGVMGTYWYHYAGNGVITYDFSRPVQTEPYRSPVPQPLPLPLPGPFPRFPRP